jgi:hypothetical protein
MMLAYLGLLLYWGVLAICGWAALRFGGRPEKLGMALLWTASLLTVLVIEPIGIRYRAMEHGVMLVDISTLAALLTMALLSDRYWPLWATSMHSISVITHFSVAMIPESVWAAYAFMQGFWAYLIMATVMLGAYGHYQSNRSQELEFAPQG